MQSSSAVFHSEFVKSLEYYNSCFKMELLWLCTAVVYSSSLFGLGFIHVVVYIAFILSPGTFSLIFMKLGPRCSCGWQ